MHRRMLILFFLCGLALPASAQDFTNFQVHGFVSQGVLYSSANNYLSLRSSAGSLQWTDGAISFSDSVSEKLRIGIQLHMYQLGEFGGSTPVVDWASGDYRFNNYIGIRGGKVKIPLGLYNDSQDVDAVYMWALLPEFFYSPDNKDTNLSTLGGEVYGTINVGKGGSIQYAGYTGYRYIPVNSGYTQNFESLGFDVNDPAYGRVAGGDIRWKTPLKGLTVGVSDLAADIYLRATNGLLTGPMGQQPDFYAKYERGKFYFGGEYRRFAPSGTITIGTVSFPLTGYDPRGWYIMTSYHVMDKLQIGTYYDHYVNQALNTSLPANYFKDWTISGRYDFNSYFYAKLEGHFIHGNGVGFYPFTNPNGLQTNSKMLAAKVGFVF